MLVASMMKFHILNSLRDNSELPRYLKEQIYNYKRYKAQYYYSFGCYPSDWEICEKLNINEKRLDIIKSCSRSISSLDSPISDDEDVSLIDTIADVNNESFDTGIENEHLKNILGQALSKLPPMEEHAIKELYYKNRTLESIGNDTGIGRERVRQLKEKGFRKLRKDWQLRKDVEGYLLPIRHVGLNEFKSTITSSVEWSVLHMEEDEEYYRNRLLDLFA